MLGQALEFEFRGFGDEVNFILQIHIAYLIRLSMCIINKIPTLLFHLHKPRRPPLTPTITRFVVAAAAAFTELLFLL